MVKNLANRLKAVKREVWEEGVTIDILSRLSVKCICSLKAVCKYWLALTRDEYFAKTQLARSRENPSFITCPRMGKRMELYSVSPSSVIHRSYDVLALNTIDPAERSDWYDMYMISSFNGLICCINLISDIDLEDEFSDMQIWICNPCTGDTLLLPQSRPSFYVEPRVGVAYATDTSDYTVFRIFGSERENPDKLGTGSDNPPCFVFECEMYSSTTGSWKNIGPVPCGPCWTKRASRSPYMSTHVYVGKKVYWPVSLQGCGEILSVDLEGRFRVINLPRYPNYDTSEGGGKLADRTFLIGLRGCLSLVIQHVSNSLPYMDVLCYKEEEDEWLHICDSGMPLYYDDYVLAMTSLKDEIQIVTQSGWWWIYNLDTRIWRNMMGFWHNRMQPLTELHCPSVFPFTESVLTCNGGVML